MDDNNTASGFEPQNKYNAKMLKLGFVRRTLWVPEKDSDELAAIAAEMRKDHVSGAK